MGRTRIRQVLTSSEIGSKVTVMGWVRTRRDSKAGFSFIEVNDGSCLRNLQVVAAKKLKNYGDEVLKIQTGCSICVSGTVVASPAKGQDRELKAEEIKVIGWSSPDYPLQKKRHTFEFLRTIAHLRPRTNTFGAIARVRNVASMAIHTFFQERGFVYLHTPIITGSDCEGAGELFKVTALDFRDIPAKGGMVDFERDFFGRSANLTVSGQLEAEIYALALGEVYTFGPTFRAERSFTSRHLAEFWMVEPEMAFCDLRGNTELAVDLLKFIFDYVLKNCQEDLGFFEKHINPDVIRNLDSMISKEFKCITYTEAVNILSGADAEFEFPPSWGEDLQSEHERYLCERVFHGPIVILDYPKRIKPFYMKVNDDNETVRAMDVLVPRIGEIIGGSQREDDYDTLVERIKESRLNPEDYWWYLDLRKFGTAPHSGFGLGFERLIQLITGMNNIRDVIPFPRTPGNVSF